MFANGTFGNEGYRCLWSYFNLKIRKFSLFFSSNSIAERAASSLGATSAGGLLTANSTADVVYYDRKEISHLVRKTWRSAHIECSAKYNWNIVTVFRELAVTLDMVANGQAIGSSNSSARRKRCLVF